MGKIKVCEKPGRDLATYYKIIGGTKDEFERKLTDMVALSISTISELHEEGDLFIEREEAGQMKKLLNMIYIIRYLSVKEFNNIVQVHKST